MPKLTVSIQPSGPISSTEDVPLLEAEVFYMPTGDDVGSSHRITEEDVRAQTNKALDGMHRRTEGELAGVPSLERLTNAAGQTRCLGLGDPANW